MYARGPDPPAPRRARPTRILRATRVLPLLLLAVACGEESPLPAGPATLGRGFVDLSDAIAAAPPFPLARRAGDQPEAAVALFADLDGDGAQEVLLSFTRQQPDVPPRRLAAFRYDRAGERLVAAPELVPPGFHVPVAAALDVDGDGYVDLLSAEEVRWGMGAGAWAPPVPLTTGARPRVIEPIWLADVDEDGWLDVVTGEGSCCPGCSAIHPLLRVGARAYEDHPELFGAGALGTAYGYLDARFGTGDRVIVAVARSCDHQRPGPAFYREAARGSDGLPRFEPFDPTPSDVAYDRRGPSLTAQSPMGAAAADLDGDGRLDLAVSLSPDHAFFRGTTTWPFEDRTGSSQIAQLSSDSGRSLTPWGIALVDVDLDGRLDAVVAHGADVEEWYDPRRITGPQHAGVYWNAGAMRFRDVTDLAHLERRGQWMALTVGDLDGDGRPEVAVGGQGELPRIYLDRVSTGHHGLALRLVGTTSNHLGLGALVEVEARPGGEVTRTVAGATATPFAQVEPLVFAGLGDARAAHRVTITWPSGTRQTLADVAGDALLVVREPPVLAIEPAGRHLPAGSSSPARILVTPRAPDGTLRPDAKVEARVVAGAGTPGPARRTDEGWEVLVAAPAQPGSSVVEVRVDGVAVGIRPRLFWDAPG